jgi:hypothetical protein
VPPGAAVGPDPVSSETTKQVKCCGDTPVRHTGVVGFNSHHLLDPLVASLAQQEAAAAWYAAGRRFDSGGRLAPVRPRCTGITPP